MSFTYPDTYFLSAVTPSGVNSLIPDAVSGYRRIFIVQGAVGTGKSAALIAAAEALHKCGVDLWVAKNPLNPEKIDGVFADKIGVAVVNGAYPHNLCEKRSGVRDTTVSLNEACDLKAAAERKDEISELFVGRDRLILTAGRYISAARSLSHDTFRIAANGTDAKKAAKFAMMTAAEVLGKRRRSRGKENIRFLSAVTGDGVAFCHKTVSQNAQKVIIVNDNYGASSRAVMTAVRYTAMELGFDIITGFCPLNEGKCEHIIVPEAGVAFVTENKYHFLDAEVRRFHARRFCDPAAVGAKRQRIRFNKKATAELIKGACDTLSQAREKENMLAEIYGELCDRRVSEQIIAELCADVVAEV